MELPSLRQVAANAIFSSVYDSCQWRSTLCIHLVLPRNGHRAARSLVIGFFQIAAPRRMPTGVRRLAHKNRMASAAPLNCEAILA